jgi:putative hemolysin
MVLTEVVIIFVLVLANAVFAGAEIAIVALRKTRVQELADQGRGSARAVLSLRAQPERFLATVQVGITVVSAAAAAFGGASLAGRLAPVLAQNPWLAPHADGLALALVIGAVSYLSIVIGELVPKSLALRSAERYALLVSKPLLALSFAARPLVWGLSASANVLLKPFGDSTTFTESRHSAEELQQLVEEAMQAGTVHPDAAEIAARALELPELSVADVMVPRHRVVAISRSATAEQLRAVLLEHPHSRLPVYDGEIDNVVGYISAKDVLALAWERQLIALADLVRPAFFVPETKQAVELLKEMRQRHLPFGIVVDEHGGMCGIVTMEDVLEELVGEIVNEYEAAEGNAIVKQPDNSFLVNGAASIREVSRALGVELPDDSQWSTVAGLVLSAAARMPRVGEVFELPSGLSLQVVDASAKHVRKVLIRRVRAAPSDRPRSGRPRAL